MEIENFIYESEETKSSIDSSPSAKNNIHKINNKNNFQIPTQQHYNKKSLNKTLRNLNKFNILNNKSKRKILNDTIQLKKEQLKLGCYNINGALKKCNHDQATIRYETINNDMKEYDFDILMVQELHGMHFSGYIERKDNEIKTFDGLQIISRDEIGVTGILIKPSKIQSVIPIQFPDYLFKSLQPKDRLYASGAISFFEREINKCNWIMYICLYRPPRSKKTIYLKQIQQLKKIFEWIKINLKNTKPNIIMGGDLNFWHEILGACDRKYQKNKKIKYKIGDEIIKIMKLNNMINNNNKDPTMIKKVFKSGQSINKEFYVDSLWTSNTLMEILKINVYWRQIYTDRSDHAPAIMSIQNLPKNTMNQSYKPNINNWKIKQMSEFKWKIFQEETDKYFNGKEGLMHMFNELKDTPIGKSINFNKKLMETTIKLIENVGKKIIGTNKINYGEKSQNKIDLKKHGLNTLFERQNKLRKKVKKILKKIKTLKKFFSVIHQI